MSNEDLKHPNARLPKTLAIEKHPFWSHIILQVDPEIPLCQYD